MSAAAEQARAPQAPPRAEFKMVHLKMRRDLWEALWRITKERFVCPHKKFHVVVNEALEEYVRRRGEEPRR